MGTEIVRPLHLPTRHHPAEASESSWRRFCCDGLDGGGATSLLTSLPPCPEGLVGKIRNGRGHQIKSSISKWSLRTEVFILLRAPEVPSRGALKAFTEAGSCIPASLHGEATDWEDQLLRWTAWTCGQRHSNTAPTFNRQSSERGGSNWRYFPRQIWALTDTCVDKEVYMIGKL